MAVWLLGWRLKLYSSQKKSIILRFRVSFQFLFFSKLVCIVTFVFWVNESCKNQIFGYSNIPIFEYSNNMSYSNSVNMIRILLSYSFSVVLSSVSSVRVSMSVCPVCALTFESLDLESSFRYAAAHVKVIGSRSRSREQKRDIVCRPTLLHSRNEARTRINATFESYLHLETKRGFNTDNSLASILKSLV